MFTDFIIVLTVRDPYLILLQYLFKIAILILKYI